MTMNKYGNHRTEVDGLQFDSRAEARRYGELRLLEQAGIIEGLVIHPVYELQPKFKRGGKVIHAVRYEADFAYTESGKQIAEDVKGALTDVFRLKMRLFLFKYPDIELRVVGA